MNTFKTRLRVASNFRGRFPARTGRFCEEPSSRAPRSSTAAAAAAATTTTTANHIITSIISIVTMPLLL